MHFLVVKGLFSFGAHVAKFTFCAFLRKVLKLACSSVSRQGEWIRLFSANELYSHPLLPPQTPSLMPPPPLPRPLYITASIQVRFLHFLTFGWHLPLPPRVLCFLFLQATHHGSKKDWMTGQSTFGELRGGKMERCSLLLSKSLTKPSCRYAYMNSKHTLFTVKSGDWLRELNPFSIATQKNWAVGPGGCILLAFVRIIELRACLLKRNF